MLNKLRNFIEPSSLEVHIYNSGVHVLNYSIISNFTSKKVDLKSNNKNVSAIGEDLVISRLQKDEIFITGNISEVLLG